MIIISEKRDCCGCAACIQICPNQCISFKEDKHGFRYPEVNSSKCLDCKLCEKVCPVLNQRSPKAPIAVFAGINSDDEIRSKSSSGGVFTSLAEYVIKSGGVVFGAGFDCDWEVEHIYIETENDLHKLRGSKYLQSRIGNTFIKTREFLNQGRTVLFSGTSCQIAGLKRYLRKEYINLITVDVVCHGVPSPLVWREYLNFLLQRHESVLKEDIKTISFRDKVTGWKNYSITMTAFDDNVMFHETHNKNLVMRLFLANLSLRPSCFKCPAKQGKSHSDITLADYWGIERFHPEIDDDKGTSMLLVNTDKGMQYLRNLSLVLHETSYSEALHGNPSIVESASENKHYNQFWRAFEIKGITVADRYLRKCRPNLISRIVTRVKFILRSVHI